MTGLNSYYNAMALSNMSNMYNEDIKANAAQTGANAQMMQAGGTNALNRAQAASQAGVAQSEMDLRAAQANDANANAKYHSMGGGGMQIGQTLGFAKGTSKVPGKGSPKVDSVKAELAPGEAVLNHGAADHLGRGVIQALNAIGMARMGMVPGKDGSAETLTNAQYPRYAHGMSHVGKSSHAGHYAKGTSKASKGGKGGKGGKSQPAPSDTPDLSKIDPKMLAAALQMGAMGQQGPGEGQDPMAAPQGQMPGMM